MSATIPLYTLAYSLCLHRSLSESRLMWSFFIYAHWRSIAYVLSSSLPILGHHSGRRKRKIGILGVDYILFAKAQFIEEESDVSFRRLRGRCMLADTGYVFAYNGLLPSTEKIPWSVLVWLNCKVIMFNRRNTFKILHSKLRAILAIFR